MKSVLNDADDVLSFFFTNSGSALRRVKTKERKKRANGVSKDIKSHPLPVDHTTECTSASAASLRSPLFSSQVIINNNNKDFTQWTPLSLSDVKDPKTNQVCISEISSKLTSPRADLSDDHKNHVTQHGRSSSCTSDQQKVSLGACCDATQGRSSLLEASPALTFSRKPRKFVYRVQNSESKRIHNGTGMVGFFCFLPLSYFLHVLISIFIQGSKLVSV